MSCESYRCRPANSSLCFLGYEPAVSLPQPLSYFTLDRSLAAPALRYLTKLPRLRTYLTQYYTDQVVPVHRVQYPMSTITRTLCATPIPTTPHIHKIPRFPTEKFCPISHYPKTLRSSNQLNWKPQTTACGSDPSALSTTTNSFIPPAPQTHSP